MRSIDLVSAMLASETLNGRWALRLLGAVERDRQLETFLQLYRGLPAFGSLPSARLLRRLGRSPLGALDRLGGRAHEAAHEIRLVLQGILVRDDAGGRRD